MTSRGKEARLTPWQPAQGGRIEDLWISGDSRLSSKWKQEAKFVNVRLN